MKSVETQQSFFGHSLTAPKHISQPIACKRDVTEHVGHDRHRPERQLIPGQKVSGEIGENNQEHEQQTIKPVFSDVSW